MVNQVWGQWVLYTLPKLFIFGLVIYLTPMNMFVALIAFIVYSTVYDVLFKSKINVFDLIIYTMDSGKTEFSLNERPNIFNYNGKTYLVRHNNTFFEQLPKYSLYEVKDSLVSKHVTNFRNFNSLNRKLKAKDVKI